MSDVSETLIETTLVATALACLPDLENNRPAEGFSFQPPDLLQEPFTITTETDAEGAIHYRMRWDGLHLKEADLVDYLNAPLRASSRQGPEGIRADYRLALDYTDRDNNDGYMHDLLARHEESMGRAWKQHLTYIGLAYAALEGMPLPVIHDENGNRVEESLTEIQTIEQTLAEFKPEDSMYPLVDFQKLYDLYPDMLPLSDSNHMEARNFFSFSSGGDETGPAGISIMTPEVVKDLLAKHPDAKKKLFDATLGFKNTAVFEYLDHNDTPVEAIATETGMTGPELAALFASGLQRYNDGFREFDYVVEPAEGDDYPAHYVMLDASFKRSGDPRTRLRPVLAWKVLENGQRVFVHEDAFDTPDRQSDSDGKHYDVMDSKQLGLVMAVLMNPTFRQDEKRWPVRDGLSADKHRTHGISGGSPRYRLQEDGSSVAVYPTNAIGPANVVLQAVRKKHEIAKDFPFEVFENLVA